ncbi:hypothetical protein GQ600_21361 [Phytophthora cactorum]|nr:hypothetical protein GQ600_21361 [Phytophthora cactorum]
MQKPDSKRSVFPPTSEEYIEWTVDQLKLECTVYYAAKLQAMWKDVHRSFSKAEARNKASGIIRNYGTITVGIYRPYIYISGVNFVEQGVSSIPGAYMAKMKTTRPRRKISARP